MRIVKKAYGHACDIRIFGASHEYGRATFRAEKLIEMSTKVGRTAEMFGLAFNPDLIMRIVSCFAKGRPGPLLAGATVARDDSHGGAGQLDAQLSALAGCFHEMNVSKATRASNPGMAGGPMFLSLPCVASQGF